MASLRQKKRIIRLPSLAQRMASSRSFPPADENGEWTYEQLTTDPASDMLYLDFDQDGQKELMTFAPFHGDTLAVYKLVDGSYQKGVGR